MRALAGDDARERATVIWRQRLDIVLAGDGDEHLLAVGRHPHARRLTPGADAPAHRLGREIDRRHLVALLQRDIHRAAIGAERHVTRCARQAQTLCQPQGAVLITVEIDAIQPISVDHQPLFIRAETEMVGIRDAADATCYVAGRCVEEHEVVRTGVADDDVAAVGGWPQMMRALADRRAPQLLIRAGVDETDVVVIGIEHDRDLGGGGHAETGHDQPAGEIDTFHEGMVPLQTGRLL